MSKALVNGVLATLVLILIYFVAISLISGFDFLKLQLRQYWYFVATLAIGFGIQIGLYSYLRDLKHKQLSPYVVATTGTTSTVAMVSCCVHYLVNILPILGVVGIITVVSQYQVELFWLGLAFNLAGIVYMTNNVVKAIKQT